MAKIVLSKDAPKDAGKFSLANAELDLTSGPFQTVDSEVIANASSHPWLEVEFDKGEIVAASYREAQVAPEDDALSHLNDKSNDPAEVLKAEKEKGTIDASAPTPDTAESVNADHGSEDGLF